MLYGCYSFSHSFLSLWILWEKLCWFLSVYWIMLNKYNKQMSASVQQSSHVTDHDVTSCHNSEFPVCISTKITIQTKQAILTIMCYSVQEMTRKLFTLRLGEVCLNWFCLLCYHSLPDEVNSKIQWFLYYRSAGLLANQIIPSECRIVNRGLMFISWQRVITFGIREINLHTSSIH